MREDKAQPSLVTEDMLYKKKEGRILVVGDYLLLVVGDYLLCRIETEIC